VKKFITFEGGEGTGKTTQNTLLANAFAAANMPCFRTREPGGSEGAEAIRALLVTGEVNRWDSKTEVLLHFAARRDHIQTAILPALSKDEFVLCDRFVDSTFAYQHYGHGIDRAMIDFLSSHIVEDIMPALTFVFVLPEHEGMSRAMERGSGEDRYEKMGGEFHRRVGAGFLDIAMQNPDRCVLISAGKSIEEIHRQIIEVVNQRFGLSLMVSL
jgi:dTMP kinase